MLIGSASTISSSTKDLINPGAAKIISSGTALLTSIVILITTEYFSKAKERYTKPSDWINVITLLNEKTLKISVADKKIDEKEALELRKRFIITILIREMIL